MVGYVESLYLVGARGLPARRGGLRPRLAWSKLKGPRRTILAASGLNLA
jgi:hypothetical protein